MARIDQSDLEPGMVVLEDVRDPEGRLLVPAETALTAEMLEQIRSWGLGAVAVRGADVDAPPPTRFRHTNKDHPLTAALIDIALTRKTRLSRRAK